jgi:hypothetical protein
MDPRQAWKPAKSVGPNGCTLKASVARRCPQGGVLSPILRDLALDGFRTLLSMEGLYRQG